MARQQAQTRPDEGVPGWVERLLEKLDQLRQADPEFLVHGADTHWYRLGPRLTSTWLEWLETKYGINLPEQYRQFLMAAGNGGAGPHYGLQRFGYLDAPHQAPFSIGTGIMRQTVYLSGFRRDHEERYNPDGTPTDGFEESLYDSMRMLAGGSSILAQQFPFTAARYTNEQVIDVLFGNTSGGNEEARWRVPGALYVSSYGCGARQMLVLNGSWKGTIWMEDLANDGGLHLEAESFEAWYDRWLASALQFCARSLNYRRLLSMFATRDPAEARALAALLRTRGIECEVEGETSQTVIVLVKQDHAEAARRLIEEFSARQKDRR